MTCCFSALYCCWHCVFNCAVVGFFAPFGTGCFAAFAMHFVKFGGSGRVTGEPGCAEPWAAALSQWLNWSLVMTVSPILATPFVGTSWPQPATSAAQAAMGSAKRRIRGIRKREVAAEIEVETPAGARPEGFIVAIDSLRRTKNLRAALGGTYASTSVAARRIPSAAATTAGKRSAASGGTGTAIVERPDS